MTDIPPGDAGPAPPPPPPPQPPLVSDARAGHDASSSAFTDDRQMALVVYILFLVAPFAFHVTGIVGLVLAYVNRDTAPEWLKSHYTFQIHTFWLSLLYGVIAGLMLFLLIGFVLIPVVIIWYIVRCALGLARLMRAEAYPTPRGWIV